MKLQGRVISGLTGFLVVVFMTGQSWGAGFFNYIQSARTAGTGGSLATVGEFDASAIFYNPASLPKSDKTLFFASTPIIDPSISFTNAGTTNFLNLPVAGNTVTKEELAFLPSISVISRYNEQITMGLGVSVPFGQSREYDENWVGRYHATKSEITSITLNPSIRYDIDSAFSIGAALNINHVDLSLDSAVDFGSICVAQACPLPLAPMTADGKQSLSGDDLGVGFSVGLLYHPNDDWALGLAYRSRIKHTLEGNADFTVPASAILMTLGGAFTDTGISTELTLPEVFSVGARFSMNDKTNLYIDASYTGWSSFDRSVVNFNNPMQPALSIVSDWDNSWRVAVGGDYALSDSSYISAGVAYDESPIPADRLGAIVPENDSVMVSLGYGLNVSEAFSVDLAYVRYWIDDIATQNSSPVSGVLRGNYELGNQAIGLQANWSF